MQIKIKNESNCSASHALKLSSEVIKRYPNTPLNRYQIIQITGDGTVKVVRLCRTKTGYITEIVNYKRGLNT